MKHFANALVIIACFVIALLALFVFVQQQQTPDAVRQLQEAQRLEWLEQKHRATVTVLWAGAGALSMLLIAAATYALVVVRNKRERIEFVDGLAPIVVKPTGKNQWTTINPNLLATPSGTITVGAGGDTQLSMGRNGFSDDQLVAMHSRQQRIQQAATKAKTVGPNKWEVMERNGILPAPKPQPQLPQLPAPVDAPPVAMLPLSEAITQSSADKFILGQSDAGQLCAVNPRASVHFAILGATGCGKTVSTGYQLALTAMRSGYQVVILDGKGGMDWSAFSPFVEVHDTDRATFVDQLRILSVEYHRRLTLCQRYQVPHISQLRTHDAPPLLVIVEEFGELLASLSTAQAAQVGAMLDSVGRKGRAADVHFCLMDQGTRHWSDVVIGATKAKALYKLAGSDAARVADWHAQTLPDVGVFRYAGQQFNAWHVEPMARKLLTTGKAAGVFGSFPAIIDGQCSVVEPDKQPDGQPDTPGDTHADGRTDNESRDRVWAYLRQHPTATVRQMADALRIGKSQVGVYRQQYFEGRQL